MASILINDEIYNLPLGDLYISNFNNYSDEDCIILDKVLKNGKYDEIYSLFNYIINSMQQFNDGIEINDEINYNEEIKEICKQMSSIDNLQKLYHNKNNDDLAIKTMVDFIIKMLNLYNNMINQSKVK